MELNKEMIKGYIESIILTLLKSEDLYGYEIAKRIRIISKESFEIKEGTLYVVLKRLETSGLIATYWGDCGSNGGRRRYNKITPLGLNYLNTKKEEWIFFRDILNMFFEEE